ncbi:MAG: CoA pyrophosphatase [Proteobacteria bacterium]|nr:CoA pyrophosphatase [Pseudomonadota bacterium]
MRLKEELDRIFLQQGRGFPIPLPPEEPPRAAVIALFSGENFLQSEILLIKRSMHVATHAGQVALPGGGVEERDRGDLSETALRELQEEVGLSREGIHPVGVLPTLPTVTGGMFIAPFLAYAEPSARGRALLPDPNEVAFTEWVRISTLKESRREVTREFKGVPLALPEFRWGEERMWGLTALIFDLILARYDKLGS